MTDTHFQRKKSEQGASLLLLIAIIGLAFIVTVAAFLLSASNGQDTARLASAKIDIATREDALMRVILQQAATAMLSGTDPTTNPIINWNTILTNSQNLLWAVNTSYANPSELATLGLSTTILANTGDTSFNIFQNGYTNVDTTKAPFGGTLGLANDVSLSTTGYNVLVEPPEMNWVGTAPLVRANALTTPQEFFLGSAYASTSASVTNLSLSNRWGQITYPNIRFGYKQPGNPNFIARRVWWRIPVLYNTAAQTVEAQVSPSPAVKVYRYPSALSNYVLSVYEIPSQLPLSGNTNLRIGLNADNATTWGSAITIAGATTGTLGSIYGSQIQLSGGNYNSVSSRSQVTVVTPATVGTVSYSNSNFDQLGTRETMALTQGTPGAAPVSVVGNDGKVLLVPVISGNQFYMAVNPLSRTPTNWDLYSRPYYRCRIRIIIQNTTAPLIYDSSQPLGPLNPNPAAGAIKVTINYSPDTSQLPDQILGFQDADASFAAPFVYQQTSYQQELSSPNHLGPFLTYWSTNTGTGPAPGGSDRNVLEIDIQNLYAFMATSGFGSPAPGQLYSIYVGSNQYTEPDSIPSYTTSDPGVAIKDAADLSNFSPNGLSIVTNQTLYLMDYFNQGILVPRPPTSIYAPQLRYGLSGAIPTVALTGQISVDAASSGTPGATPTPPVNPMSLSTASGLQFTPNQAALSEIIAPKLIPPITRVSLMFTIEKERTQ
jgi:hypothetical protein